MSEDTSSSVKVSVEALKLLIEADRKRAVIVCVLKKMPGNSGHLF